MKAALALRPELGGESFPPPPDGIVTADVDPTTGLLATDTCPSHRTEYFVEGTQPTETCETHSSEHPEFPPIPGFEWPEDQIPPDDKAKKVLRDADKENDNAAREMKKQIKKATGKP